MLYNYSKFLKINANPIYWKHNYDSDIKNSELTEFFCKRFKPGYYKLGFRYKEGSYGYTSFLLNRKENLLIDDNLIPNDVREKLKTEFWKNPEENVKNMEYDPMFLGNLQQIRDADKYNL
jgi:hypothetical protein